MRISDWSSDVCSSDLVYRSMGVEMPRNTSKQAISPALEHRAFTDKDSRAARIAAAQALQVGDLVYIPRQVVLDWKRVEKGKSVSVRVDFGGRGIIKKKTHMKRPNKANRQSGHL